MSIQQTRRHSQTAIPICYECLNPMVASGKRQMPFTNLAEVTYRCDACSTEPNGSSKTAKAHQQKRGMAF